MILREIKNNRDLLSVAKMPPKRMFEVNSSEKLQVQEKNWSQQVEHMQVPNGTGASVRRSKCPLEACYIRDKCSMETSNKSVKGRFRFKGHGLV